MFSSTFLFLGEPVSFSADADDIEVGGKTNKAEKNLRPDGNGLVQFQAEGEGESNYVRWNITLEM